MCPVDQNTQADLNLSWAPMSKDIPIYCIIQTDRQAWANSVNADEMPQNVASD